MSVPDKMSLPDTNYPPSVTSLTTLLDLENISTHNLYLGSQSSTPDGRSLSTLSISSLGSERDGQSPRPGEPMDYSALDRFGFIVVSDKQTNEQEKQSAREARRALKWVSMLTKLEQSPSVADWPLAHHKFERRLIKGIPDCLRNKIWSFFVLGTPLDPNAVVPTYNYRDLYLKISGFERQIDLDIERTLRDHVLFRIRFSSAQVSLFKILVAYSNYDPVVGYCQGMSTVAAFLLMYFEEEAAFGVFVRMMHRDRLRLLYMTGFQLLFEAFFIQEKLMEKLVPHVHARLAHLGIMPSVYATKWYLTLFLGFPITLATRIWDLFLFYGFDILIVVAIALLKYFEERINALEYEACMQFLSRLPDTPIKETRLLALSMKIWHQLVPSEPEHRLESFDYSSPQSTGADAGRKRRKSWKMSVFAKLRAAYGILQAKNPKAGSKQ